MTQTRLTSASRPFRALGVLVLLSALLLAFPASTRATEAGQWFIEVFGGWNVPPSLNDTIQLPDGTSVPRSAFGGINDAGPTWGARAGAHLTRLWGFQVAAGFFEADSEIDVTGGTDMFSTESTYVEISAAMFPWDYFQPTKWIVYAGPGVAQTDVLLVGPADPGIDESGSNFSFHIGGGYDLKLGKRVAAHLDGRVRYVDGDAYKNGVGGELNIGLRFDLGKEKNPR